MEATINRNKSVLAAVSGPDASSMVVYHDMDGRLGGVQGAPVNVESCFTYSGTRIGSPTFNADGTRGWWATADGLVTAPFAMTAGAGGCGNAVNAASVVAGASSPRLGPGRRPDVAPRRARARPGARAEAGPGARAADQDHQVAHVHHRKKVALRKALRSGLVLTVPGTGKATATATAGTSRVGSGSTRTTKLTLRFTAKAKKSLARKRRVIVKIAVTRGAQHATTATTLAR